MTVVWPRDMLVPRDWLPPTLINQTVSGPASLTGRQQVIGADAGYWKIEFANIPVHGAERIRKWHELEALIEGRLNPVLVPVYIGDRGPGDEPFFGDGSGFSDHPDITAHVHSSAAVRATTLQINVTYGGPLKAGMPFSIGVRLYRITSVVAQSGDLHTVTVRPPLREVVAGGTAVEFNRPVCKCRLASDNAMDLPLAFNRYGFASVSFVEDPF